MRTWFVTIFLAFLVCASEAQNISRQYDGISISQALTDIAKASADYKINFIYNELDEFPVICHFQNLSIVEAIMRVVGQYPVKISIRDRHIFVECAEKRQTKVRGKIVGLKSAPVAFANITIFDANTNEAICSGVSNEAGDFSIPCDSMRIRIRISCVGYKTLTKTCFAGGLGTIQLHFSTQELQNIEVTSVNARIRQKENKRYKKHAAEIRRQIWSSNDSVFLQTTIDDSLRRYSSVTLAESFSSTYDRRHSWSPFRFFYDIFAGSDSPGNTYLTTSKHVVHRRIVLNDLAAVQRYAQLDYPRGKILENSRNFDVVMGVRVIHPDGSVCEIDTDPYTQPLDARDEKRPEKIYIPGLAQGDIIDFFTWTAHKTSSCHPEPMFVKFDNEFPVLSSKVNLAVDKKLSIQYRFLGNVPKLSMRNDKKGFVCLSCTKDKEALTIRDTIPKFMFYVRDPQLRVNAPQNTLHRGVLENPSIDDVLNTTGRIYHKICSKEESRKWATAYWSKADTTIIGLKVDNLCQMYPSRASLRQHLYEMVLCDPSHSDYSRLSKASLMGFNKEYMEKLAYVFERAKVPYHIAMSTRPDREEISELMDEENIVWVVVGEDGKCFIPFQEEGVVETMVGRRAATTDYGKIFTIQ